MKKKQAMTSFNITDTIKKKLLKFLKKKADLVTAYLFFIELKHNLKPVLFPREKKIYQSLESLIEKLEKENKLWRKTLIKIQFGKESVNQNTKKIYICPFTGKVFGDNTHANPQDAIYDWISKCKENTERVGGLRAKRFFVSEDPKIIKSYIKERKKPINKEVFSSAITGKLFNSKEAVIEDFKNKQIKYLTLHEVQNQNKYEIETHLLKFLQEKLTEENISKFVESLSTHKEFATYLDEWLES